MLQQKGTYFQLCTDDYTSSESSTHPLNNVNQAIFRLGVMLLSKVTKSCFHFTMQMDGWRNFLKVVGISLM